MIFTNDFKFDYNKPITTRYQFSIKINRGLWPKYNNSIPKAYWELIQRCWKQDPNERPIFEEITEDLKSDKFVTEEFGNKTDLDQLHEYQERINKEDELIVLKNKDRKTQFNWKRN